MARFEVSFIQYHTYDVEADTEEEAEDKAFKEFQSDMRRGVSSTFYGDMEIKKWEECKNATEK